MLFEHNFRHISRPNFFFFLCNQRKNHQIHFQLILLRFCSYLHRFNWKLISKYSLLQQFSCPFEWNISFNDVKFQYDAFTFSPSIILLVVVKILASNWMKLLISIFICILLCVQIFDSLLSVHFNLVYIYG